MLINREPLKRQIPSRAIMRLHRTREINRRFHPQILHPVLHNGEIDSDDAGHLDSATERNLAVALREMEVAHAELGAFDVDGEIDFATSAEVLDVAISAVFGTAWG